MENLKSDFSNGMLNLYLKTIKETKYRPSFFKKMLDDLGGVGTAQRLLSKSTSSGFTELWELDRLDLTVEAFVIDNKEKYQDLFTQEELNTAYQRLEELSYFD